MYEPLSQKHRKVLQLLLGQYYNTLHVEGGYDLAIRVNVSPHPPANNIPSGNWLLEIMILKKLQVLTERGEWNRNQPWYHFLPAQLYFFKAIEPGIIKRKCHRLSKAKDRQFYRLLDHVLFIDI